MVSLVAAWAPTMVPVQQGTGIASGDFTHSILSCTV
jgi:hypothetical protein